MSELDKLLDTMFQAHPWHGVPPGDPSGILNAYIEIVPSDVVKYELDKADYQYALGRPDGHL